MSQRRRTVLLVDDEREFLDILSARLKTRGLEVDVADSGAVALEKVRGATFDAVLLDLAMPGMDGLETLRSILAHDPTTQVIILTGHATISTGLEAINLGALDMLEKPVPMTVLLDKIEEAGKRKQRIAATIPPKPTPATKPTTPRRATASHLLQRLLPFLTWLPECRGRTLRADMVAGISVALVLIPQSMAYAQLAGLPAYYGLYAAFLPPVLASLFGSSRQLATGPVAVVSLMTAAALEPIATAGSESFIAYAIVVALLVGVFQFLLGVFRLGAVVNFLSHPVVNGFTNAAALIIATSQLSKVFGVHVDSAKHHYETVARVLAEARHSTHLPTFSMALLAFAIMIALKKFRPKVPNVLAAVAVTTVVAWAVGFEKRLSLPIETMNAPAAVELITTFNALVEERQDLEKFRADMNKYHETTFTSQSSVCGRCHTTRPPRVFDDPTAQPISPMPVNLLYLHHRGNLLQARIEEIRDTQEPAVRAQLRALRFHIDDDGAVSIPEGGATGASVWRLKVGNRPLDTRALPFRAGGEVVGAIPSGLPTPTAPRIDVSIALKLLPVAMIISILGFMEAVSIAKAMASRTHQRLDPNQELIGQGIANTVGSFFQSFAVSGSFSRSAVNFQSGAVTGFSNVFASVVVVITLLFLTPLLYHLPQATLAAIIIMAVVGLVNVHDVVHAWKAQWFDGLTAIVTFVVTLIVAPHLEWGILAGVVLSLGAYLQRSMRPNVAMLALHPDGSLRDATLHRLGQCRYIAAIRFDGPLNFASCSYLEEAILTRVSEVPTLREVLIVAHGINEIDSSGEQMLEKVLYRLQANGCRVSFSGVKENVVDALRRTRLWDKIGEDNVYPTQLIALRAIYDRAHAGEKEPDCPLRPSPRELEAGTAES